jgi:UrcA family protein
MHNKIALFKAPLLLATIGLAVASGVAVAAEPNASELNGIVVQYGIVVQSPKITTEYSPWSRTWVEHYSANVRVAYSDLNLADTAGVQALHARVVTAAQFACQKLNRVIAVSDQKCVEGTLAATQPRVQAALNAAMQAAVQAKQERARS